MIEFIVIDSIPGYLPEAEPVVFSEADEARRYIIDELLRLADDGDVPEEEAETMTFLAEDVNLSGDSGYFPYVYAGCQRVFEMRDRTNHESKE